MGDFMYYIFEWHICILILLLLTTSLWLRSRRPFDLPPGPVPLPLIGNILTLFGDDILKTTRKLKEKYGSLYSLSLGPYWVVFVNDVHTLQDVFIKNADYFSDRPDTYFITDMLRNKGISGANGPLWKEQRTFTLSALRRFGMGKKSMESRILEETCILNEIIDSYNGEPKSLGDDIGKSVSNVMCLILLGKRFDYDDPKFLKLLSDTYTALSNPYLPFLNWFPLMHTVDKVSDVFGSIKCQNIVQDMRKQMKEYVDEHKITLDTNDPRDIVDALLMERDKHAGENHVVITDDDLAAMVTDLFGASAETTTVTLLWSLLFLVNNPDVQSRMYAEIINVVGENQQPTIADRRNLPYCEAVINETQRLGNIVPFSLPHAASSGVNINGYRIPKGAIVMPTIDSVMHDERLFPDSCTFNPDRFLDNDGAMNDLKSSLFPFSLGRRVCLGESLARMEIFLFLTSIIRRYKIVPLNKEEPPPVKGHLGVVHSPQKFSVRFHKRSEGGR